MYVSFQRVEPKQYITTTTTNNTVRRRPKTIKHSSCIGFKLERVRKSTRK